MASGFGGPDVISDEAFGGEPGPVRRRHRTLRRADTARVATPWGLTPRHGSTSRWTAQWDKRARSYPPVVSPRTRVVALVALAAVAAAGTAVGGALLQERAGRGADGEAHGQTATTSRRGEPPALELAVIDRDDPEARALRAAERLYEEGRTREARRRFEALLRRNPGSVEAAVGAAMSAGSSRETPEAPSRA
jgi:hypothetical protein